MQITTTKPPLGWQTKPQYEKSRRKAAPPEEKQHRGKQLGLENATFNVRGVPQVESDSDSSRGKYRVIFLTGPPLNLLSVGWKVTDFKKMSESLTGLPFDRKMVKCLAK